VRARVRRGGGCGPRRGYTASGMTLDDSMNVSGSL